MPWGRMKNKDELYFDEVDAPSVIVLFYSVETYRAVSKEQAEKEHIKRCIKLELPDNHSVYS